MNEYLYTHMIADLSDQVKNKTLESAEYRARLAQVTEEKAQVVQDLAFVQKVLDSDKDLKELFDEQTKKLEEEVAHGA
ncbi:hypothetical protein [Streptococcus respiraculi]|uniref:hypothetical protein n=1 Tax=Streptococcus respiraculi TaxID=2021971 RepID=UPI000E741561|nr:hypothetical protein [Streptococcus respiraculi]